MRLIYEDDWLIVVDKPSGLLSMSTGRQGEVLSEPVQQAMPT